MDPKWKWCFCGCCLFAPSIQRREPHIHQRGHAKTHRALNDSSGALVPNTIRTDDPRSSAG
jgi:hypothetical protein